MSLKKFNCSDNFVNNFTSDGYVVLKNLLSKDDIENIKSEIYEIFLRYINVKVKLEKNDFREFLTWAYYERNLEWKTCAKLMHRSLALMHCASQLKIQEVLHKVGMKFPIRCGEPEVRVDLPDNIQYNQLWHQDWRTGQSSLNSVTIWFPLHDVSKKNGAIEIYPESHLWGFVDTIMHENPRRFEIIDKRVKNFSGVVANLQFGECVVFSQMLVHRSGQNTSNLARICCQIRYADATEENYIKNSYKIPLDHKNQFVWDNAPDEKIMKKVYDFKDK